MHEASRPTVGGIVENCEITDSLDMKYVQMKDGQDRDLIKVVSQEASTTRLFVPY